MTETSISESEETSQKPKKSTKTRVNEVRGNKKVRLGVILVLMLIVAALFIFWGKARIWLAAIFLILLGALGLEVSNTDFDLGTLWETKSLEQSKVTRDQSGNILFDKLGNITTDATQGKGADEYNCDDFETQPESQVFFERVGGTGNDVNRLDGDKDGEACESLPQGN